MAGAGPESASGDDEALEDRVLATVAEVLGRRGASPAMAELSIGDDAAVVVFGNERLVVSADALVAGVHADLALVSLEDFGWKALSAAVSDLAAMGARPGCALVTYCLPPATDVVGLTSGLAEASAAYQCPIVGGDLSAAAQLSVSVTVLGPVGAEPPGVVTRGGARPGDELFVTGPCGGSAAGLRVLRGGARGDPGLRGAHARPRARLDEGSVARAAGVSAMIDVSDGLARDLDRLAVSSGVGIWLDAVPAVAGATTDEALTGGEDFELVMATPDAARLRNAFAARGLREPLAFGHCTGNPAERRLDGSVLEVGGWQHRI